MHCYRHFHRSSSDLDCHNWFDWVGDAADSQPTIPTAGFCGIRETETDQTLVDGTHITHKSKVRFCRDSRSRTREEYFANDPRGEPSPTPTSIHIFDPVEGANYSLDVHNRIAHRTAIPQSPPTGRIYTDLLSPNPSYVPAVDRKVEHLDSQMMEGLLVEGTRTTITTPTGMLGKGSNLYWSASRAKPTSLFPVRAVPRFLFRLCPAIRMDVAGAAEAVLPAHRANCIWGSGGLTQS